MAQGSGGGGTSGASRGLKRSGGGIADWEQADADILRRAIATAALTGGALRLGYSRDGGAYAVGIYGDGDVYTEWCSPSQDLNQFLLDITSLFESIRDDQLSSRGLGSDGKPKNGGSKR